MAALEDLANSVATLRQAATAAQARLADLDRQHLSTQQTIDTARARETGGVGLGLAIVNSCIQACGGTVVARHREDGATGLAMEIVLPADPGRS